MSAGAALAETTEINCSLTEVPVVGRGHLPIHQIDSRNVRKITVPILISGRTASIGAAADLAAPTLRRMSNTEIVFFDSVENLHTHQERTTKIKQSTREYSG